MSDTTTAGAETAVRPFRIEVPQHEIEELRRRIDATRWPTKELVTDRSQGVQLAAIQELARFWTTDYDWRQCEARLNALPQFKTKIDGLDIHFIHVKSKHENALPLIMTHGWPGSIIELLETIGPLTDPTAHGGRAEDAFHLVLPSIPGYGFSDEPTELGWGPIRIGQAWDAAHAAPRLHAGTSRRAATWAPRSLTRWAASDSTGLLGIHTNLLTPALGDPEALERVATHQRGTCCPRPARRIPRDRHGLLRRASDAPGDDWLRPPRFTHRPRGLDDRSRYGQPTRRSPAPSSTSNPRAISPANTSSTTSRCIGSQVPGPRRRARTGRKDKRTLVRPARLPRRSRFRSASPRSPERSGGPRAAGSSGRTPTSTSTSTRSTRAATSPPGRNRELFSEELRAAFRPLR